MAAELAAYSAATLPGWKAQSRARQPAAFWTSFQLFASLCLSRFRPQSGHTGDYSIVLRQWTTNDHSLSRDLVRPEFMAVVAPTHLDHRHHSPEPSFDLDVPLDDDLVGDERHLLRCKACLGECLGDFSGHEYRDAGCGQCPNQAVERLPEVLAEGRGEGDLEP